MIPEIREREDVGGFIFGIGVDGQGEFAEVYAATGERLDMHGPDTNPVEIRRTLAEMKAWWLSGEGHRNPALVR